MDIIKTARFDIHRHEILRPENIGMPRTVFQAWYRLEDVPKPVCIVTVNECFMNYVEWIHVDEQHRRKGIATEVMAAIESAIGGCEMEGVTDEGEKFCEHYAAKCNQ